MLTGYIMIYSNLTSVRYSKWPNLTLLYSKFTEISHFQSPGAYKSPKQAESSSFRHYCSVCILLQDISTNMKQLKWTYWRQNWNKIPHPSWKHCLYQASDHSYFYYMFHINIYSDSNYASIPISKQVPDMCKTIQKTKFQPEKRHSFVIHFFAILFTFTGG